MIKIPFSNYPHFTQIVDIDLVQYKLEFKWNSRGEYWLMNILNTSDVEILSGIKLVLNFDLLEGYKHLAVPQGKLFVADSGTDLIKIDFEDFNNERKLSLVYIPVDEL